MPPALALVPSLVGLLGILLGAWLGARWADRRESRRLQAERVALERRAEHERAAARAAWTRERRYEVHSEALRELRQVRLQLSRRQRRGGSDDVIRPLMDVRSRLDLVASREAVDCFGRLLAAIHEVASGERAWFLGPGELSTVLDVDTHLRAYVEWARVDLDQEVDQGEVSDRMLSAYRVESRRALAEIAACEEEAAAVAEMHC